jgi:hypothetical protein
MKKKMKNEIDCTVIVSSCDHYADLWKPFFLLFQIHWSNCPYPVALITENKLADVADVRSLQLGEGLDWSSLLLKALDKINTSYVLLMLEDFFFRKNVDSGRVEKLLCQMENNSIVMLRLITSPGPTKKIDGIDEYGEISKDAAYRVSTQAAFWNTKTLRSLIMRGESAWEFEINGTNRSRDYIGFAGVWQDALPYGHHVIERGKWFPWELWRYRNMDIGIDCSARKTMNIIESLRWVVFKIIGRIRTLLK